MKSPHRICAEMHKEDKPEDPRTVDELEAYYRSLSQCSPFGALVMAWQEADALEEARFEASMAIAKARK